jgi:hypothetical protein
MDTHHTYDRIFGVVVNKDRFDINVPVGHGNSQVIMERPIVPLGPLFRYLINLAARFYVLEHEAGDLPGFVLT